MTAAFESTSRACACCGNGMHQLDECSFFIHMDIAAINKFVFGNRRCFSCLRKGHLARFCKFKAGCGIAGCNQNHHQMLHDETQGLHNVNQEDRSVALVQNSPQTLLQIVPVRVNGRKGRTRDTLALLDPGSQTSLCADAVVRDLLIPGEETQLFLKHIGGTAPPQTSPKLQLLLSPLSDEKQQIIVPEAFSVPQVNIRTPLDFTQRPTWPL